MQLDQLISSSHLLLDQQKTQKLDMAVHCPPHLHWQHRASLAEILVFDLDGTLIDSDLANLLAYKEAASHVLRREANIPIDLGFRLTRDTLKMAIPDISEEEIENISIHKKLIYSKYLHTTRPNKHLLNIIKQSIGKKIILATNSRKARADAILEHHGLADKFDIKIYGDSDEPQDKYHILTSKFLSTNDNYVVFENDDCAIQSAISCNINPERLINITEE